MGPGCLRFAGLKRVCEPAHDRLPRRRGKARARRYGRNCDELTIVPAGARAGAGPGWRGAGRRQSAEEALQAAREQRVVLVDVRTPAEWKQTRGRARCGAHQRDRASAGRIGAASSPRWRRCCAATAAGPGWLARDCRPSLARRAESRRTITNRTQGCIDERTTARDGFGALQRRAARPTM